MENNDKEPIKPSAFETKEPMTTAELVSFASEVGFSIALPLAGFAVVGHLLDNNLGTGKTFLIVGLLLSIISTSVIIYNKVKGFLIK
ncbi:MAG: AtpZ/AtpI family protein [Patescibacteria group bacterium]